LEALRSQSAREFCPIPTSRFPLSVQERQVSVECALPAAKDIRALTAADLANDLTAVPRPADDFFDWDPVSDEHHDRGVGLLAPQITLILQPFRTGEQLRIDRGRADRGTDQVHGPAHRPKESRACIFHQMPAVGDLECIGQRLGRGLAVAATAVA
jgi:hypothetical protein